MKQIKHEEFKDMLNNIDVNTLIDESNPTAIETSNIAKILFGDDYIIAFSKYIFGYTSDKDGIRGKLYNTSGDLMINKELSEVAPMIILETKEVVGYMLLSKEDKVKDSDTSVDNSNLLDSIKVWLENKSRVDVLEPDGKLGKATLLNNYIGLPIKDRIDRDGISYKGKVYRVVLDFNSSINYLIHTGKVGD